MKRLITLVVMLLVAATLSAADYILIRIEKGIAMPVKVQTSKGTYLVSDNELRIDGNVTVTGAFDANGKVMVVQGTLTTDERGVEMRFYDITRYYKETPPEPSTVAQNALGVQDVEQNFYNAVGQAVYMDSADGFPYLGVEVGRSRFWSNYLRARLAGGNREGFMCYAGVGKEGLFRKDLGDDIYWHLGGGYYLTDDLNTFEFGLSVGSTPLCNTFSHDTPATSNGLGVMMDVHYGYFIPNTRFGLFGGAGLGVGFAGAGKRALIYDLQMGIVVRLFSNWK